MGARRRSIAEFRTWNERHAPSRVRPTPCSLIQGCQYPTAAPAKPAQMVSSTNCMKYLLGLSGVLLRLVMLRFLVLIGGSFFARKGRSLRRRTTARSKTDSTPTVDLRGSNPPVLAVLNQRT